LEEYQMLLGIRQSVNSTSSIVDGKIDGIVDTSELSQRIPSVISVMVSGPKLKLMSL
jgi:hypothetical protein